MKRISMAATAASVLALTAGAAMADGIPGSVKDAPATECCTAKWSGLYIAGSVGYSVVTNEIQFENKQELFEYHDYGHGGSYESVRSQTFKLDFDGISSEGATGTIAIGYDREIHKGIIIGVFGDYTFGDQTTELDISFSRSGSGPRELEVESGWSERESIDVFEYSDTWSIGARVGLVRSCCTMWYLMAGYTETDLKILDDLDEGGGIMASEYSGRYDVDFDRSRTLEGYFIGGGVTTQLHGGLFLEASYRFSDFGDEQIFKSVYEDGGCNSECTKAKFRETNTVDLDTQMHSIRVGVAYKFDFDREAPVEPLK